MNFILKSVICLQVDSLAAGVTLMNYDATQDIIFPPELHILIESERKKCV